MRLKIEEAIVLQNFRQGVKNHETGKPDNFNKLTKANLGRILWPNQRKKAPLQNIGKLCKGELVNVKPVWINIICRETEVDPNFLFGYPSKHDDDYDHNCLF